MTGCPSEDALIAVVEGGRDRVEHDAVLEHLDACASCRAVVAELARVLAPSSGDADERDVPTPDWASVQAARLHAAVDDVLPSRVGRFEVRGVLGRGGMGIVLEGFDPELDRPVAIKLVGRGRTPSREVQARQLREAVALARVSHPNVVEVFDTGVHEGRVYVAMELVQGRTLRNWLAEAEPPQRRILAVLAQLARGLAAVHDAGLVHRDFKPDNAIVTEHSGGLRAQIVDFGLARMLEDGSSSLVTDEKVPPSTNLETNVAVTRTGTILGTPAYMAPEQHRGETADPKSDQFAFAVTAIEALRGHRPFRGDSLAQILEAIESGRVELPCGPTSGPRAGSMPRRVRGALLRGLRADPGQRWPSMADLAERLRPEGRRRWAAWGLFATAALGGMAAMILEPAPSCRDVQAPGSDVWPARADAIRAAFAAHDPHGLEHRWPSIRDALDGYARQLSSVSTLLCEGSDADSAQWKRRHACVQARGRELGALLAELAGSDRTALDQAEIAVAALESPQACRTADFEAAVGDDVADAQQRAVLDSVARLEALLRLDRHDEAVVLADDVYRQADAAGLERLQPSIQLLRGRALRRLGRFEEAESALSGAYFDQRRAGDRPGASMAALEMAGMLAKNLNRPDDAKPWLGHAESLWEDNVLDPRVAAEIEHARGLIAGRMGHLDEALASFQRAVTFAKQGPSPDETTLCQYLDRVGMLQAQLGRHEASVATYEETLALQRRIFGDDHVRVIRTRSAMMTSLRLLGRLDDALEQGQLALAAGERSLPSNHAVLGDAWLDLGGVYFTRGDLRLAREALTRALEVYQHNYDGHHPRIVGTRINLALVERRAGELDRSVELLQGAVDDLTEYGGEQVALGYALSNLADTQWLSGHLVKAIENRRAALESSDEADPGSLIVRRGWRKLCEMELQADHLAPAESSCARALEPFAANEDEIPPRLRRVQAWRVSKTASEKTVRAELAELPPLPSPDEIDAHIEAQWAKDLAERGFVDLARQRWSQAIAIYEALGPGFAGQASDARRQQSNL